MLQVPDQPHNAHNEASLLGSAAGHWHGFNLEWLEADPDTLLRDYELPVPVLAMIDRGKTRADFNFSGRSCEMDLGPDSIGFFAEGTHFRHSRWRCEMARRISLVVDFSLLSSAGFTAAVTPERLQTKLEFRDEEMSKLLRSMIREAVAGSPNGQLFAEALSLGVASRLLRKLGDQSSVHTDRGVLTLAQARAVEELVGSGLNKRLVLADLARAAGFSPAHFVRLCRNTFGCTPHQYVSKARLARARRCVEGTASPLSEIAEQVGYSSQSHMTSAFVSAFGVTPGALRREKRIVR